MPSPDPPEPRSGAGEDHRRGRIALLLAALTMLLLAVLSSASGHLIALVGLAVFVVAERGLGDR